MIEEGKRSKAKYWGGFVATKVIKLDTPVVCHSDEVGTVEFSPTIAQIAWDKYPSDDKHDLWFPYWIRIRGKEKYGTVRSYDWTKAPLELLSKAIGQDLFTEEFLLSLRDKINAKRSRGG